MIVLSGWPEDLYGQPEEAMVVAGDGEARPHDGTTQRRRAARAVA